jgi:hypothetical protein
MPPKWCGSDGCGQIWRDAGLDLACPALDLLDLLRRQKAPGSFIGQLQRMEALRFGR